jgi:hypothetical protein
MYIRLVNQHTLKTYTQPPQQGFREYAPFNLSLLAKMLQAEEPTLAFLPCLFCCKEIPNRFNC